MSKTQKYVILYSCKLAAVVHKERVRSKTYLIRKLNYLGIDYMFLSKNFLIIIKQKDALLLKIVEPNLNHSKPNTLKDLIKSNGDAITQEQYWELMDGVQYDH